MTHSSPPHRGCHIQICMGVIYKYITYWGQIHTHTHNTHKHNTQPTEGGIFRYVWGGELWATHSKKIHTHNTQRTEGGIYRYVWGGELQGGADPYDALICRLFFAKEPLILGHFCRKWPIKLRRPMGLHHPVWVIHTRYTLCVIYRYDVYDTFTYDIQGVAGVYDPYRVAKTHRMPYLYRSFSAKEPMISGS